MACGFDFRFMQTGRGFFCFPEVELGMPFLPGMNALLKKALPLYKVEEMQYQGTRRAIGAEAHCEVCHGMEMEFSVHHGGMEAPGP